jgi:aromatic-L-amino-acid/L-tryptophan decarboxylase
VSQGGEDRSLRLDASRAEIVERAAEIVLDGWRSFDQARGTEPALDEDFDAMLRLPLPIDPTPALQVLEEAAGILDRSIAQPRPRYFAFIGSSGLPIGVIGDMLAACFDVNLATWAAAATRIEEQAVQWAAEFLGFPASTGAFTSGGTVSNVTALAAARERALPGSRKTGLSGTRCALYASVEAHYSVKRAAELLGIGDENVRLLPIDDRRRLLPESLASAIDADRAAGITPVAAVATTGTTLTGAVDPLTAIADVCEPRGVWLHVDGAYGGAAATVPSTRGLFVGLDRADSLSVDAHKWMYLPKACGIVLARHRADLEAALAHEEAYIPHDRLGSHMVDITLEYSRPFRALKLWMAFRAHGVDAIRTAIERNLSQAKLLYGELGRYDDLEPVCGPPDLTIVPFRHVPPGVGDLNGHNARLVQALQEDGRIWIAPANVDGTVCLRPCFVNFRTTNDDVLALIDVTREVGAGLVARDAG